MSMRSRPGSLTRKEEPIPTLIASLRDNRYDESKLKLCLQQVESRRAERPAFVDQGLVQAALAVARQEKPGSLFRLLAIDIINALIIGDDQDPNTKRSDLQRRVYPLVIADALKLCREEPRNSNGRIKALEMLRRLARNYDNKPRLFAQEGVVAEALDSINLSAPAERSTAFTLILTLATDENAASGLVSYPYGDALIAALLKSLKDKNSCHDAIKVIANLSHHPHPQQILNEPTFIAAVVECVKSFPEVQMQAIIALANLIGKDEVQSEILRASETGLVQLVKLFVSLVDGKLDGHGKEHWTIPMVLQPLAFCLIPETNRALVKDSLLGPLLTSLNQAMEQASVASAFPTLTCLLQLSFDEECLRQMRMDTGLAANLEKVISVARSNAAWLSASKAADAVRFRLAKDHKTAANVEGGDAGASSNKQLRCMVSYNWKHQPLAIALSTLLSQVEGLSVWIDIEKMSSEIMESMANAVSGSQVIFIMVSENYKNSAACKCEAMYAFEMRKRIVPLVVQPGYVPDGWLGALLAGKLRYDVSSKEKLNLEYPKILNEVNLPMPVLSRQVSLVAEPAALKLETNAQVIEWLKSKSFAPSMVTAFEIDKIDGKMLAFMYANYDVYASQLHVVGLISLGDKLRFHMALKELFS